MIGLCMFECNTLQQQRQRASEVYCREKKAALHGDASNRSLIAANDGHSLNCNTFRARCLQPAVSCSASNGRFLLRRFFSPSTTTSCNDCNNVAGDEWLKIALDLQYGTIVLSPARQIRPRHSDLFFCNRAQLSPSYTAHALNDPWQ